MEVLINNMSLWLEGMPPILTFFIIIFLIVVLAFKKTLAGMLKKISFKDISFFKKKEEPIKILKDHDIFNVIERVRIDVKHAKFETNGEYDSAKTKMFHDFMGFKLDVIRKNFKAFLKDLPETDNMDGFKAEILKLMNATVAEYIKTTEDHFISKGINKEATDYVIELFEEWRKPTITALVHRVDCIFASGFHVGKFEKLLGTLEVFSMAIDLITRDGIASFEEMNGRFKNLKY